MKYLDCIVLSDTMLTQLCDGTRVQVPLSRIPALRANLAKVSEKSEELEISYVPSLLRDIVIAFEEAENTKGLTFFPADIRSRLCAAIKELQPGIACCVCRQ